MSNNQKEMFYSKLRETKKLNSKTLSRDDIRAIKSFLIDGTLLGASQAFKRRISRNKFKLVNTGGEDKLFTVKKKSDLKGDDNQVSLKLLKRVVPEEEIYDIIHRYHNIQNNHSSAKTTYSQISVEYDFIPRKVVEDYCSLCTVCTLKKSQTVSAPLQPIISSNFMERMQVDLIDLRNSPDGEYNWICHVIDHFSKYHVLFPMKKKEAKEVAWGLKERVFSYFGLPFILHSDNGREFVNNLILDTVNTWPGKCKLVNGKARSPWVQGCVEKGNHSVEMMISAKRQELNSNDWVKWLPDIQ